MEEVERKTRSREQREEAEEEDVCTFVVGPAQHEMCASVSRHL
jgi:hypothetical protein